MRVFYQVLTYLISKKEEQSTQVIDCNRLLNTASDMLFIMNSTVELGLKPKCKFEMSC